MLFKKEREIAKLQCKLIDAMKESEKYLQEIKTRNKTVCPKCIHSVEAFEKHKYRAVGDTTPYYNSEPIHVCKFGFCAGFEPKPISENNTEQ
jgi:hypothetical protein